MNFVFLRFYLERKDLGCGRFLNFIKDFFLNLLFSMRKFYSRKLEINIYRVVNNIYMPFIKILFITNICLSFSITKYTFPLKF